MSWKVEIVKIGAVESWPGAERIEAASTTESCAPYCVAKGQFAVGDLAVLFPIDARHPEIGRVKARKIKGMMSCGVLEPVRGFEALDGVLLEPGMDVTELLGIVREDPEPSDQERFKLAGDAMEAPAGLLKYTDIEALQKYYRELGPTEELYITEKLHGTSVRYRGLDVVASRNVCLKFNAGNLYWRTRDADTGLLSLLECEREITVYGEIVGPGVQKGFGYGLTKPTFFLYDASLAGRYLEPLELFRLARTWGIRKVPTVWMRRPPASVTVYPTLMSEVQEEWMRWVTRLAMAPCRIKGAPLLSEGIVVRPWCSRLTSKGERCIFKFVNPDYLMEKHS